MGRDNIAGIPSGFIKRLLLFPGMIIQWSMYMFVGAETRSKVIEQTRLARSPLMTFAYSSIFWLAFVAYLFGFFER